VGKTLADMTALDLLLIIVWLAAMAYGYRTGLVRQVFLVASILVGILLSYAVAPGASFWTGTISTAGRATMLPFTFSFLVVLIAALLYVLLLRTYPDTRLTRFPRVDRLTGVLMGFLVGLVVITEINVMLLLMTDGQWAFLEGARASVRQQLTTTPFFPTLAETFPQVVEPITSLVPKA
jgi:uncharacterized membrane protein required for colicin V production